MASGPMKSMQNFRIPGCKSMALGANAYTISPFTKHCTLENISLCILLSLFWSFLQSSWRVLINSALLISSSMWLWISIGYSAKGLNCTEDKSCGFHAKTSSNSVKPCNVLDAKVFMAYATTDAYKGHVVPFPMRCFIIMFPIV